MPTEFIGTNETIKTLVDYLITEGYVAGEDFKFNIEEEEYQRLSVSHPIGELIHRIMEYLRIMDGYDNVVVSDCFPWIDRPEEFLMYLHLNMFGYTKMIEEAYDKYMATKRIDCFTISLIRG